MCGYRNSRAASLPLGCFPVVCPAYGDAVLHCPISENREIQFFALRIKKRVFNTYLSAWAAASARAFFAMAEISPTPLRTMLGR